MILTAAAVLIFAGAVALAMAKHSGEQDKLLEEYLATYNRTHAQTDEPERKRSSDRSN